MRRWERARVAWAVTIVACLTALPAAPAHRLAIVAGYFGWFLNLLDVNLVAMAERRRPAYTAGWVLLGASTASALLASDRPVLLIVSLWTMLALLVWRAWRDVGSP